MNKVMLVGRLADNPVSATTSKGNQQSKITVATQDNRDKKKSYFFPCIAWNTTANFINSYIKKGDLVAIDGQLTKNTFITKDGKQASTVEIIIENINILQSNTKKPNENSEYIPPNEPISTNQPINQSKEDNNINLVDWNDDDDKE